MKIVIAAPQKYTCQLYTHSPAIQVYILDNCVAVIYGKVGLNNAWL